MSAISTHPFSKTAATTAHHPHAISPAAETKTSLFHKFTAPKEKTVKAPSLFSREKENLVHFFGPYQKDPKTPKEKLHHFCRSRLHTALQGDHHPRSVAGVFQQTREFIAKLIFLFKKDDKSALRVIETAQPSKEIDNQVKLIIEKIKERLDTQKKVQQRVGIQDPDFTYRVSMHREIAESILLPSGRINIGLIPILKQSLLESENRMEWMNETGRVLAKLQESPELCDAITNAKKSNDPNALSNEIIRLSLHKSPDEPITDQDARLVILEGLFPPRQGPVGNCFVICNAILMMVSILGRCIEDFIQLIECDELVRKGKGERYEYPFKMNIADEDSTNEFRLFSSSEVKPGVFISDCLGIQSACIQLGIQDMKRACIGAAQKIFQGTRMSSKKVTIPEFIQVLVQFSPRSEGRDILIQRALLAFGARTHVPIQHAWLSALAGMDQYDPKSFLKSKIVNCWEETFGTACKLVPSKNQFEEIKKVFSQAIVQRLEVLYDECVRTDGLASDGRSTAGSYLYFRRDPGQNPSQAVQINDYRGLSSFTVHCFKAVDEIFEKKGISEEEKQGYQLVSLQVKRFAENADVFADAFFANYDRATANKRETLQQKWNRFQKFGQIGGDNTNVFQREVGFPLPKADRLNQHDAKGRFKAIVEFLRECEKKDRFLESKTPVEYEMDTDDHALNLKPQNETIAPFVTNDEDIGKLIDLRIGLPCCSVLNAEITSEQKHTLLVEGNRFVAKKVQKTFADEAGKLSDKTVQTYTKSVLDIVLALTPGSSEMKKGEITASFTNMVIDDVLSNEQKKVLKEHTVYIPDLNWEEGVSELFTGFVYSPLGTFETVQIDEKKENLLAINQAESLHGPWNLYKNNLNKWSFDTAMSTG